MNHLHLCRSETERDAFIEAVKADKDYANHIAEGVTPANLNWRYTNEAKTQWEWYDDDTAMVHGGWCLAQCHAAKAKDRRQER